MTHNIQFGGKQIVFSVIYSNRKTIGKTAADNRRLKAFPDAHTDFVCRKSKNLVSIKSYALHFSRSFCEKNN